MLNKEIQALKEIVSEAITLTEQREVLIKSSQEIVNIIKMQMRLFHLQSVFLYLMIFHTESIDFFCDHLNKKLFFTCQIGMLNAIVYATFKVIK